MRPSSSGCWRWRTASCEPTSAEDEVPEPPEDPVSRPGDLWVLGNHRLLCGDATVLADVERVLGGQLADMCFTDRPYNVDYANSPKDKLRGKHRPILNDNLGSGFEAFLYDACINILSVTKGAVYCCMSSSELHTLQRAFAAAGGNWCTFVVLGQAHFHARPGRLPTPIRTDPVRLEGRAAITTGAAPGIRATSGSSTSRPGTIYTRP